MLSCANFLLSELLFMWSLEYYGFGQKLLWIEFCLDFFQKFSGSCVHNLQTISSSISSLILLSFHLIIYAGLHFPFPFPFWRYKLEIFSFEFSCFLVRFLIHISGTSGKRLMNGFSWISFLRALLVHLTVTEMCRCGVGGLGALGWCLCLVILGFPWDFLFWGLPFSC